MVDGFVRVAEVADGFVRVAFFSCESHQTGMHSTRQSYSCTHSSDPQAALMTTNHLSSNPEITCEDGSSWCARLRGYLQQRGVSVEGRRPHRHTHTHTHTYHHQHHACASA